MFIGASYARDGLSYYETMRNAALERRDAVIPEELKFEKEIGNVFIKD